MRGGGAPEMPGDEAAAYGDADGGGGAPSNPNENPLIPSIMKVVPSFFFLVSCFCYLKLALFWVTFTAAPSFHDTKNQV